MSSDPVSSLVNMDCNNFFDHIDDLLDFHEENSKTLDNSTVPPIWNVSPHSLLEPDLLFRELGGTTCSTDLAAELSIPYEDIVQMEWLSNFMEDSFSPGDTMTLDRKQFPVTDDGAVAAALAPIQFHLPSPISVLESSSSSGSCSEGSKVLPPSPDTVCIRGGCGRARSKRPRPPTFKPGSAMQLLSPAQSFSDNVRACGEELNESPRFKNTTDSAGQKKVKVSVKPSCLAEKSRSDTSVEHNASESLAGVRKCLHCEITKTPQWRAGPLGPKTLCNACGVRYKSGRLFPEYRPAASPTFVPSLHSNSHKKVLEMRTTTLDSLTNEDQPEFNPNKDILSEYI